MSDALPKHFSPEGLDAKWGEFWEREGWYSSRPGKGQGSYSIVLPPPNVTGTLHMGHAFQHTLMDALVRRERMRGRDALWQPGVDHAGIATQIVVTRELERKGIDPKSLSREELLGHIWKWKEESGSTITRQMRRIGASCDWERERFTMDEGLSGVVTDVFVRLYREGLIYRGKRMVNWDPVLLTAVSDLEVVAEEEDSKLYHVLYPYVEGEGGVVIATTRPETILADGAIAVHPDDERNAALVGRKVWVPMTDRQIPVIADSFVDPSFGSGRVKITAAHDFNDYACSLRHPEIPLIEILTPDARMSGNTPEAYRGLTREEARERIVRDLAEAGLLEKEVPHRHSPPRGDRTGVVLEPMLTDQWFVKARELAPAALELARSGDLEIIPGNWRAVYEQWLENIDDWCVSRQLVWGHRIPAWHAEDGRIFVARDEQEARRLAGEGVALERDPDVLDTWFSSSLWPFSTLGWPDEGDEHFKAYFPTSVLVTGFDIIFFWVARMAMMSRHFLGKTPFRQVYITGLVRDAHGEKMSKSKGNTLDPLDLIDGIGADELAAKRTQGLMNPKLAGEIEARTRKDYPDGIPSFGADALRMTFSSYASYGRDIKFDLSRCGGYRSFCNKLWNAARFAMAAAQEGDDGDAEPSLADRWIVARLGQAAEAVDAAFAEYRFDLATQEIYRLVWDEYCSWYLEAAKVQMRRGSPEQARSARRTLAAVLEAALRLAHPLMPFITEELWQKAAPLAPGGGRPPSVMGAPYPVPGDYPGDAEASRWMAALKELVEGCRKICGERDASRATRVDVSLSCAEGEFAAYEPWFSELAGKRISLRFGVSPDAGAPRYSAAGVEVGVRVDVDADPAEDLERLGRLRAKLEADLEKVERKLGNPDFVARAPEAVVAQQRERRAAIAREIAAAREQAEALESSHAR